MMDDESGESMEPMGEEKKVPLEAESLERSVRARSTRDAQLLPVFRSDRGRF